MSQGTDTPFHKQFVDNVLLSCSGWISTVLAGGGTALQQVIAGARNEVLLGHALLFEAFAHLAEKFVSKMRRNHSRLFIVDRRTISGGMFSAAP